jgi:hypothetical protein
MCASPNDRLLLLADDGSWLCEHRDADDQPAPPTRLDITSARSEQGRSNDRRRITCPDCGTLWRVWPTLRKVIRYTERHPDDAAYRWRHDHPECDIDRVIALLVERLPAVHVTQHQPVWPPDDDGLWWFGLAASRRSQQLESGSGMCPFFWESDENPADIRYLQTPEEAADIVFTSLTSGYTEPGDSSEHQNRS